MFSPFRSVVELPTRRLLCLLRDLSFALLLTIQIHTENGCCSVTSMGLAVVEEGNSDSHPGSRMFNVRGRLMGVLDSEADPMSRDDIG